MADDSIERMIEAFMYHQEQAAILQRRIETWQTNRTFHDFLRLPPELRLEIYDDYTENDNPYRDVSIQVSPHLMPIARTARAIRKEYLDRFFETQIMPFGIMHLPSREGTDLRPFKLQPTSERFFSAASEQELSQIRRLRIAPPFRTYDPSGLGWTMNLASGDVSVAPISQSSRCKERFAFRDSDVRRRAAKLRFVLHQIKLNGGALQRGDVDLVLDAVSDMDTIPVEWVDHVRDEDLPVSKRTRAELEADSRRRGTRRNASH